MLTDTLAHDINNLLMIVAGCCERLGSQTGLTSEQRAELDRIALATQHAGWLTSQLMLANRGAELTRQSSDFGRALGQGVQLLEHALGQRIRIETALSPRATWVPLSEGEVTQILINLALNARDAMPHGGLLTIATTAVTLDPAAAAAQRLAPGDYVSLEVSDTGTGMSADAKAQAFDRYFTTKGAGRGSGLGLASVKRVAQQCGGTVDIRSQPGEGTRFTIVLPIVAPQPAAAPAAEETTRARAAETVLVAEDEPVVRDIVASILRTLGYHTLEVSSAEEALTLAGEHRVDLLVADIDLPDVNGVALAERLAKASPSTRVLFMSGYDGEWPTAAAVDASAFLVKPFTGATLGRKVRDILDAAETAGGAR